MRCTAWSLQLRSLTNHATRTRPAAANSDTTTNTSPKTKGEKTAHALGWRSSFPWSSRELPSHSSLRSQDDTGLVAGAPRVPGETTRFTLLYENKKRAGPPCPEGCHRSSPPPPPLFPPFALPEQCLPTSRIATPPASFLPESRLAGRVVTLSFH